MYLACLWYPHRPWPNHNPSIIRRTATHLSFKCPADKFPSCIVWDAFSTFNRDSPSLLSPAIFADSHIAHPNCHPYSSSLPPPSPFPFAASTDPRRPSRSSFSTELRSALGGLSATLVDFGLACENRCDAEGQLSLRICIWQLCLLVLSVLAALFKFLRPSVCRSSAVFHFVVSNAGFLVMRHVRLAAHPLTLHSR